jgi:hypothetical protein
MLSSSSLLGIELFAIAKAMIVFAGTLLLSLAIIFGFRRTPAAALLLGGEPRAVQKTP